MQEQGKPIIMAINKSFTDIYKEWHHLLHHLFLDAKLLPCVKSGGLLYLSFPGMKKDLHEHLPPELLLSWTPEQLDYLHDLAFWNKTISASKDAKIISLTEMESNGEVWRDWLACDNEYAMNDRKSMNAGGGKYQNFIAAVLRKK